MTMILIMGIVVCVGTIISIFGAMIGSTWLMITGVAVLLIDLAIGTAALFVGLIKFLED